MPVSEAQKRASAKYRKANVKQAIARFYPSEADLWEFLQTKENKSGYIKDLIRRDMEVGN